MIYHLKFSKYINIILMYITHRECGKDVLCVRYSSDGRVLACGLSDGQVKVRSI